MEGSLGTHSASCHRAKRRVGVWCSLLSGRVRSAAALSESVLCLPTDLHSLLVNTTSWNTCNTSMHCLDSLRSAAP